MLGQEEMEADDLLNEEEYNYYYTDCCCKRISHIWDEQISRVKTGVNLLPMRSLVAAETPPPSLLSGRSV